MSARLAPLGLTLAGISCVVAAQSPPRSAGLFDSTAPLELTLTAPFQQLFANGADDEKYTVEAALAYRDAVSGAPVVLRHVRLSERGHTSRRETECTFPKLKVKLPKQEDAPAPFEGVEIFKIGTHCGENADDTLTHAFGRLANEKSPLREALAYRMLDAAGVPTLRTRPARITYVDDGRGTGDQGQGLVRNALLVEDEDSARNRVQAASQISLEDFGNVEQRHADADAIRIAFGEAMIGNFDWCLRLFPGDRYRCDDSKPLWNVFAFERRGGATALLASDFDLAGVVVGRHPWFTKVYNAGFVASRSPLEIEVLSQVQRTRSLFDRSALDNERRRLLGRKADVFDAIDHAVVDPPGRDLARAYATAFFADIAPDGAFYRPVVAKLNEQVYADAGRSSEACGARDAIPVGTPVDELQHTSSMIQVLVLDALWRWAPPHQCKAVETGPVWIASDAASRDYPRAASAR